MENPKDHQERDNNNSNGSSTTATISRSDINNNPYPTTFVQADTSTFKQVVQMLTGSSETSKQACQDPPPASSPSSKSTIPPIRTAPKRQGFKLYERRNNIKTSLMISTLVPGLAHSPRHQEILSPSLLNFPNLTLSPVTPLNNNDPVSNSSPLCENPSSEEDRAIAQKGFYFHPSPTNTPRDSEPQLLPLFPLTSPRISSSGSPS